MRRWDGSQISALAAHSAARIQNSGDKSVATPEEVDDAVMVITSELWIADLAYNAIYADFEERFPSRPPKAPPSPPNPRRGPKG